MDLQLNARILKCGKCCFFLFLTKLERKENQSLLKLTFKNLTMQIIFSTFSTEKKLKQGVDLSTIVLKILQLRKPIVCFNYKQTTYAQVHVCLQFKVSKFCILLINVNQDLVWSPFSQYMDVVMH